jgi:ATP-dependent DNA ligase
LDGFRLMAQRRGVGGRLLTRNGNDWTERYPSVVAANRSKIVSPFSSQTVISPSIRQD